MITLTPTRIGLVLGATAGMIAALLGQTSLIQRIEAKPYDVLVSAFARPELGATSRVKVLLYTDDDVQIFKREYPELRYPPPRSFYADVMEQIRGIGVEPGAFVFDIIMSESSNIPGDDEVFATAVRKAGNVAMAMAVFPPGAAEGTTLDAGTDTPPEPLPAPARIELYGAPDALPLVTNAQLPMPAVQDAVARFGNAYVKVDRGDLLRTMPIAFRYLDTITPSLPVAAVMAYSGDSSLALEKRTLRRFAGIDVPVVDGKLLVNFRGPRGTFPTASLTSALALKPSAAGEAWRQSLRKGDIVVIGANVTGHPDVQSTPVDESLPGPEFIATVIDNLLRGDARSRLPGWLNFLIPIVLGATVGLTAVLASRKRSALVLVLPLVLAYFGIVALAFANGLVLDVVTPFSGAALAYTGSALYLFNTEGKKRREIRQSFSRYLAPEVVTTLEEHPEQLRLGGERREMTIQFSDLAGFTGFSERMKPEELVTFLNEYLTAMTDIILDHQGVIDKYLGDAIMAFWGAPIPREDHARLALSAVAHCQQRLQKFVEEKSQLGLPKLMARTGINTGHVVVGNMGSNRRFDYTVMGDSVNLASRLEGANKFFDSIVMVTDATLAAAGEGAAIVRPLGRLRVKGKNEPVGVHELLGAGGALETSLPAWAATFGEGLALFQKGEFKKAAATFERSHAARPGGDPVSQRYIKLCEEYRVKYAAGDFDGIITLTEK